MIKINIQCFGGRGASSGANTSNKPESGTVSLKREMAVLEGKIKANEAKIEKLSKQNETIYYSVPAHDFENPKWDKWRANSKVITALKRENGQMEIRRGQIRIEIEPKQKKAFVNGYGEATRREITTSTYKRAQKRLEKEFDLWFKGRR